MNCLHLFAIFLYGLCFQDQVLSALIVPSPSVATQSASTTSITLNWTMPYNELYDYFTLEVRTSDETLRRTNTNQLTATVKDLFPGTLYTFIVSATRGSLTSDQTLFLQETAPLPPTNLRLETFQSLTLSMHGIFGNVNFDLKVPGIQAEWMGPAIGDCDCFEATITPPDGKVARSVPNDRLLPGCQADVCGAVPNTAVTVKETKDRNYVSVRKYLQLKPGQTYTIRVRSTTCGHGYLGRLKSALINATITLPPATPPPITPMMVTETSAYLSWEKGELPGFYDNFEVISSSRGNENIKIHAPVDPRTRGRNVSGLKPCEVYIFEVYTLYKKMRSEDNQSAEVFTKPSHPFNLLISNFNETSISIRWRHREINQATFFRVSIEHLKTFNMPSTSNAAVITGLTPGTWHNLSVSAVCSSPGQAESVPVWTTQVTVPVPPDEITSSCQVVSTPSNRYSRISLSWLPPRTGEWDGFAVDYSPFEFESLSDPPMLPLLLPRESRSLNISLPAIGRFYTVYVRATRDNVLSESTTTQVQCHDSSGRLVQHCRARFSKFRIIIRSFNASHLSVQISGIRIKNVTVELSDVTDDVFVSTSLSFIVVNPCLRVLNSNILNVIVHPVCGEGRACRPIKRKLCDPPRDVEIGRRFVLTANSCCSGKSYSTIESKCCHGKLEEAASFNRCCYTRWYDPTRQKCCGRNRRGGIVKSSLRSCFE